MKRIRLAIVKPPCNGYAFPCIFTPFQHPAVLLTPKDVTSQNRQPLFPPFFFAAPASAANVAAIAWLTGFDLTGSWLLFLAFVLAVLLLLYAFLKHLFSFLSFLKQN